MTDSPYQLAHARLLVAHLPATISAPIRDLIDRVYDGDEYDLSLRAEVTATVNRYGTPRMRDRVSEFLWLHLPPEVIDAIRAEGDADRAKEGAA